MVATDKVVLVSRVSNTSLVNSPAKGLLVYQTTGSEGFYFYDGSVWQKVGKDTLSPGSTFAFATSNVPISNTLTASGYVFRFGFVLISSGITRNIDADTFTLPVPGLYSISYNLAITVPTNDTDNYYTELLVNGVPAIGSQADSNTNRATRFILANFVVTTQASATVSVRIIGPSGALISSNKLRTLSISRLK